MPDAHPLARVLADAACGKYPPDDGRVDVMPALDGRADAMVGFTGHWVLAADIDPELVHAQLPDGDFSAPMSAVFLHWVAAQLGSRPGTFDALLCALGTGEGAPDWLTPIEDLEHPRVARASRYRRDMQIFTTADGAGVIILGRGICGRWEIGYEVDASAQGRGLGRRLVAAARGLGANGEPVWAQVAPGNAASLRATLAGGFTPVAAEVLFPRA